MKYLIVVDMQVDFVTGSLGTEEAKEIVENVENKIKEYLDLGYVVIFTKDTHPSTYLDTSEGKKLPVPHCIKGTEGHNLIPELLKYENQGYVITKKTFGYSGWKDELTAADEVELIGLCTDICVISNALIIKALYPEISIRVDASCCAGVTPALHQNALNIMRSCQIDVVNE